MGYTRRSVCAHKVIGYKYPIGVLSVVCPYSRLSLPLLLSERRAVTAGACAPSDCSGSSLSRLAFSSVFLFVFVSFLYLPWFILYLVSLSLPLRLFGVRRLSLSLPLSISLLSLSLSLFVVRAVARGLFSTCCCSVLRVTLYFVLRSLRLSVRLVRLRSYHSGLDLRRAVA